MRIISVLMLGLVCLASNALLAQEIITVDRVEFNSLRDRWIQVEIELTANENTGAEAKDSRFIEDIKVKPYLVYANGNNADEFVYLVNEVKILIMERGDRNNVYFYIPGLLAERDNMRKDPDYFYVEIEVNGEVQAPQKNSMGGIKDLAMLENMKSRAESGASANEGFLLPIYFAPNAYIGRVDRLPVFLRVDPKE